MRGPAERAGVLGELMHVDDVSDGTELVQRTEREASLPARLQRDEEQRRGAADDEQVYRRFHGLHDAAQFVGGAQAQASSGR